jgi:hypothetical protein
MTPINAIEDYLPLSTGQVALSSDGGVWMYHPPSPGGMVELVAAVTPTPPVNTQAPNIAILTDLAVGSTLVMQNGQWTGSPTFTREWTSAGVVIPGAVTTSYVLQQSDVGNMIGGNLTGTNQDGSVTAATNTVGPVIAPPLDEPPLDQEATDPPAEPTRIVHSGSGTIPPRSHHSHSHSHPAPKHKTAKRGK